MKPLKERPLMEVVEKTAYCRRCGGERTIRSRQPKKFLNETLFHLTFGVWLLPYFFLHLLGSPWRCTDCGERVPQWKRDFLDILPWLLGTLILIAALFLFI